MSHEQVVPMPVDMTTEPPVSKSRPTPVCIPDRRSYLDDDVDFETPTPQSVIDQQLEDFDDAMWR